MKIKTSFTTNSSSSSFVVIDNSGKNIFPKFGTELVVDNDFGETEFGWGPGECRYVGDRINFAYLQTLYGSGSHPEWLVMLENVIKNNTGVKEIDWRVTDSYNDAGIWGYIDHQSCASEGENIEIFESEEVLKNFLFGEGSYIVLDNDNH